MSIFSKIIAGVTLAFSGESALSTTATIATAGWTAVFIGADPWPWVLGAGGAAVVYAHKQENRAKAMANGLISVMLGGLAAPWIGALLADHAGPLWGNKYAIAFVLSAGWPWIAPYALRVADKFLPNVTIGGNK